MRITGILLAAGAGVRFGGGKLLAPLPDGTSLGRRSAANLIAVIPEVIAVVRPGDDALARELAAAGARITTCADAHAGMGASLAHGVRAAAITGDAKTGEVEAFIVALADMPWIEPATISDVADHLRRGEQLVAPRYHGQRGHPVGFGATHFAVLRALTGDQGARTVIASARNVCWLDVDDPGVLRDVDVKTELGRA